MRASVSNRVSDAYEIAQGENYDSGMKLGWHIGYWGRSMPQGIPETIQMVESLGYDSAFTAESWGVTLFRRLLGGVRKRALFVSAQTSLKFLRAHLPLRQWLQSRWITCRAVAFVWALA